MTANDLPAVYLSREWQNTMAKKGNDNELIGTRHGRFVVSEVVRKTRPSGKQGSASRIYLRCACDCGNICDVDKWQLFLGKTRSCGCLRIDVITTHGEGASHGKPNVPEFITWIALRSRCSNKNNTHYHRYGGRGITVCDRWLNSYENFLSDMGRKPSPQHSIDRIDNDKGYSPDNCRWATRAEQSRNRSSNHRIEFNGRNETILDWARLLGIRHVTLYGRLNRCKWSVEKAFTEPCRGVALNQIPVIDKKWGCLDQR